MAKKVIESLTGGSEFRFNNLDGLPDSQKQEMPEAKPSELGVEEKRGKIEEEIRGAGEAAFQH